jgi:hypothetical protein
MVQKADRFEEFINFVDQANFVETYDIFLGQGCNLYILDTRCKDVSKQAH